MCSVVLLIYILTLSGLFFLKNLNGKKKNNKSNKLSIKKRANNNEQTKYKFI